MKKFRILVIAFVAMLGFSACSNDDHNHNADDHTVDLVGTWTCLQDNYAEVLVINDDGSAVSYGVEDGEYWEDVKGNIVINDGKIIMTFENNDNFDGHFDIIPGMAFSIYSDKGERLTYNYCPYDLSKEIIGMWVCTDGPMTGKDDMMIRTFTEGGEMIFTGVVPIGDKHDGVLNRKVNYKVIGDLVFIEASNNNEYDFVPQYTAERITYAPNTISLGDIMAFCCYLPSGNGSTKVNVAWLRVEQNLNLSNGKTYEYSNVYVTNVKGEDKEIDFVGHTLNFSKLDGKIMDKMLKNILFNVSFSTPGKISYNCFVNGKSESIDAPVEVEGNRVTIKMSANNPIYRDIDVYAFQDADGCQMHMYMPTSSYTHFIANISVVTMAKKGKLDLNNTAAVAEVFDMIDNAIESINVSLIFHDSTRAL